MKGSIGNTNAEIINNMVVNIVENSYGKPYLSMDAEYFEYLSQAKRENYRYIYRNERMQQLVNENLRPMFEQMYERLLEEANKHDRDSYLYKHHLKWIALNNRFSRNFSMEAYEETEPNQLVVDYIAGMTDDYFVDLYHRMFPTEKYDVV